MDARYGQIFVSMAAPIVSMKIAEGRMNDFKQILYHGNVFTPQDSQSPPP
ncbi:hypothetical protein P4S64_20580 [Vibrio sp. M60_M31a]